MTTRMQATTIRTLTSGILAALCVSTVADAVETRFWRVDSRRDHEDAEVDGVAIDAEGAITLSLSRSTEVTSDEIYLWEIARGDDDVLFLGSGDSGHVLRSDGGEPELLADLELLEVMALAVDDDVVYAGGAPDGTVYAIDRDGTVTPYFDTEQGVVWDLALHPSGDLLVTTGETGKVFRVSGKDDGEVIYESTDAHIMCVTVESAASILIGTAGDGLVCRLDGEGGVEILYDAAEEEIRSIVLGDEGEVFLAVNVAPGGDDGDGPRPAVYALGPHGSARRVWRTSSQFLFALDRDRNGDLIAGTGEPASIVRIEPHRRETTTLLELEDGNVLAVDASRDEIRVATGDPARLFTLGPRLGRSGTIESEVRDAGAEASWSRIRWTGDRPSGTEVTFETRTGNRETPDRTWSAWTPASDEGANGHRVTSSPARFLQWRATLTGNGSRTPRVTEVVTSYREVNLRPVLQALDVSRKGANLFTDGDKRTRSVRQRLPGGVEVDYSLPFDGGPSGDRPLAPGSVAWAAGLRTVSWVAIDPNGDELRYDLHYRPVESERWLLLAEDVNDLAYTWDGSVFPDGDYVLRVVARDTPSNPDGDDLEDVLVSEVFEIDNTPPRVASLEARLTEEGRIEIEARASDERSAIVRADVTLDGQEWMPARTSSGFLDAREVSFDFSVDAGDRTEGDPVVLRVVDEAGNPVVSRTFLD